MREQLEQELLKERINGDRLVEIIPQLRLLKSCTQNHPAHLYNVLEHSIKVVEGVPKDLELRLIALFHDTGKAAPEVKRVKDDGKQPEVQDEYEHFWGHEEESVRITRPILEKLGYERRTIENILNVIEVHDTQIGQYEAAILGMMERIGQENFEKLLIIQKADLLAHAPEYAKRKMPALENLRSIYRKMKK